jgi:hypothetical protein
VAQTIAGIKKLEVPTLLEQIATNFRRLQR